MTTPNNNSNRELRDDELDAVTGGLVVISIIEGARQSWRDQPVQVRPR